MSSFLSLKRCASLIALGASFTLIAGSQAVADPTPSVAPPSPPQALTASPTTRVLAIGRLTKPPGSAEMQAIMPKEVRDTVDLYLSGKIADWYIAKDAPGVVFIMDVRSTDEARALTADLPLVKAGMMQFQFTPLGPFSPLRLLT